MHHWLWGMEESVGGGFTGSNPTLNKSVTALEVLKCNSSDAIKLYLITITTDVYNYIPESINMTSRVSCLVSPDNDCFYLPR